MTGDPVPDAAPCSKPSCAWCSEVSITEIFVEGNPETKRHRTAPVCRAHELHFLKAGAASWDAWLDEGFRREWKKAKTKRAAGSR